MRLLTDLRTLQSFVTVAREGNVSRAAEQLHITQPAVSLQIKRLSDDTGLALFRRTAKGVELTRDGEVMLAKAERVLAAMRDLDQTAKRMTGSVRGTLRIGTIVDPDFIRLGAFLAGLLEAAPDLQAQLIHGMSGDVPVRLQRDGIDVGYVLDDPNNANWMPKKKPDEAVPTFRYRPLTRFNYCVIAPAGWERRVSGLGWRELAALPWIGTPAASVHQRLLERKFNLHDAVQNQVALVDQEPSMLAMARSGVGLCLCRESTALHEKQSHGIVIAENIKIETELGFLTLQGRCEEPSIKMAFEVLEQIWSAEY
jgi:DNA-binding transcriptional LysR family regulator